MKLKKTGYMHRPTDAEWNEMMAGVSRLNFEKALFDTTYQSGTLSGLEVQQQAVPNLTVKLTAGRAVYRDTATGRGKVIEVLVEDIDRLGHAVKQMRQAPKASKRKLGFQLEKKR